MSRRGRRISHRAWGLAGILVLFLYVLSGEKALSFFSEVPLCRVGQAFCVWLLRFFSLGRLRRAFRYRVYFLSSVLVGYHRFKAGRAHVRTIVMAYSKGLFQGLGSLVGGRIRHFGYVVI